MRRTATILSALCTALLPSFAAGAGGDAATGARAFRSCAACHSLEPGRHSAGPSLAGVWGRKAGTAKGFGGYSAALKSSGIVWNDATLDAWLANPRAAVPGNAMGFPGVFDAAVRAALIAYLKAPDAAR